MLCIRARYDGERWNRKLFSARAVFAIEAVRKLEKGSDRKEEKGEIKKERNKRGENEGKKRFVATIYRCRYHANARYLVIIIIYIRRLDLLLSGRNLKFRVRKTGGP